MEASSLEQAHITEIVNLVRGRGGSDSDAAALLRAEADRLTTPPVDSAPAPVPATKEE